MKKTLALAALIGAIVTIGIGSSAALGTTPPSTSRVSVSSSGAQGDYSSFATGISARGRYVSFSSDATTLVKGDTNGKRDAFVHDRLTGKTTRVSVSSTGAESHCSDPFGCSSAVGITGDGRYVAIVSDASDLVPGDTNEASDVFVHDRRTGETTRVSISDRGLQGNGASGVAAISSDGRYVAFTSGASNLVAGDTNGAADVFIRDLRSSRTTRVDVDGHGRQTNRGSDSSGPRPQRARPLYRLHFQRVESGRPRHQQPGRCLRSRPPHRSHDQGQRAQPRPAGWRCTAPRNGSNAPSISANGRYVAFHSVTSNLVRGDTNRAFDIFVRDRKTHQTRRVSVSDRGLQANAESFGPPSISPDGRYVAFGSLASNLVAGDANDTTDVFVYDRRTGGVILASRNTRGVQGNDGSANAVAAFSVDNAFLAFSSWSSNLVDGDTNGGPDAFVRRLS